MRTGSARVLALAVLACLAAGGSQAQAPAGGPPPAVTVATVATADVAPRSEFIGRLEAIQAVDLRARVQGFLHDVLFQEGQDVKEGDPLFSIEPDLYQAAAAQAQAQVGSAEATLRNAEVSLQRRQELVQRAAGSQAELDAAIAARDTAAAAVAGAQAQLRTAQLNVGYTNITSPIAGRIGKANVTRGNLVGPDSGVLARVVQLDPIQVVFSVSERDVIDVQRNAPANATQEQIQASFVPTLRLANGQTFSQTGRIAFLGNEVDPTTGTVPVRATFPNPGATLLPGGTVYVTVRPSQPKVMPLVPVGAVQETRDGKSVLVVGSGNTVEVRPIVAGTQVGQNWAVEKGIAPGETIIVQGLQKVRPGMLVNPVQARAAASSDTTGGIAEASEGSGAAQPAGAKR